MNKLLQISGSAVLLCGIALPTAQAQITISGSLDFTQGTDGAASFILNETGGQLANGTAITATLDNFLGSKANVADVETNNGIKFDESVSGSNTYSFDLTFSSNIQNIVITSYTTGDSQAGFTDGSQTLTIAWAGGEATGLSLADDKSTASTETYATSLAVVGNILTFSESSGPPSVSGKASLKGITFEAVAATADPTWAGYTIDENGDVDTDAWLSWINASKDHPWVFLYDLNKYIYLPESHVSEQGGWLYIPN